MRRSWAEKDQNPLGQSPVPAGFWSWFMFGIHGPRGMMGAPQGLSSPHPTPLRGPSLGLDLLPGRGFPWHVFRVPGPSNFLRSPLQLVLHSHSFSHHSLMDCSQGVGPWHTLRASRICSEIVVETCRTCNPWFLCLQNEGHEEAVRACHQ